MTKFKIETEKQGFITVLIMGMVLFPLFFILDLIIYPDYKFTLLAIRMCVALIYGILLYPGIKMEENKR